MPCAETSLGQSTTSELTCTVTGKTSGLSAREQGGDAEADAPPDDLQPSFGQSAMLFDVTETGDAETFARRDIKITNLQATMTSNKYIAGRLPIAAEAAPVDDLIMFSPDYLSTKLLPHTPKRKPVGVGLVTVPKPPVKESDTTPPDQWFPQPKR
jgi:hypothetical protein